MLQVHDNWYSSWKSNVIFDKRIASKIQRVPLGFDVANKKVGYWLVVSIGSWKITVANVPKEFAYRKKGRSNSGIAVDCSADSGRTRYRWYVSFRITDLE